MLQGSLGHNIIKTGQTLGSAGDQAPMFACRIRGKSQEPRRRRRRGKNGA